jgi:hypothetical protein
MKRTNLIVSFLLTIGLVLGVLQGCKGPEGPAGPAGESKILQLEGFAPDINCGDCHNPDQDSTYFVWAKRYQWELSKHYYGGDYERNSTPCAGCHTTEGYVQRMLAGNPTQDQWGGIVTDHVDASPPGCFACHSPHSNGNFAFRTVSPVTLLSPMSGVSNQTVDMGTGNVCLSCHQPRDLSPQMPQTATATDTMTITNSRWYPHYGVQGLMFKGVGAGGGFEFPGKTYANSPHASASGIMTGGCPTCHMADATAGSGIAGGHTMNIHYVGSHGEDEWLTTGCTQSGCHSAMTDVENYVSSSSSLTGGMGARAYVEARLDSLNNLLIAKNFITSSGTLKTPLKASTLKLGALYNYFFIEHDLSGGIHNSKYAIQLLNDSIEEMNN